MFSRKMVMDMPMDKVPKVVNIDSNRIDSIVSKPKGLGIRHLQAFLLFWGYGLSFAHKVNLSVGIVAMLDNSSNPKFKKYDWDQPTVGIILSSLFWGFFISPIFAGLIAHRYGGKLPLLIAAIISSIMTALTPFAADLGWKYLCASRIIIGLMQGFFMPCIHSILAKWAHPLERGFITSVVYSGSKVGIVTMMAVSGVIAASEMGWPAIFYFSGGFDFIWAILWGVYGSNSPAEYKKISAEEKAFMDTMPGTISAKHQLPWLKVMTSLPFLSLIAAHSAMGFGYSMLLNEIPSYIGGVLKFSIKSNALLAALPYLAMLVLLIILSSISDYLTSRGYLSIGAARKVFNTIGSWGPAICLVCLGYVVDNVYLAMTLLIFSVGFFSGGQIGFFINHIDLSPNFAGALMGITCCFGNILAFLAPLFVGFIVTDLSDVGAWRIAFTAAGIVLFLGNLMFVIFGKGTIQSWNEVDDQKSVRKSTETVQEAF